ncbi:hypothetical protein P3X46_015759 [Hevea brasiliensis]|uniref:Uncharacterized protein n=3 Tax=Hevea brasiliensis TaxID=3981 RepID=A0ABQ9LYC1_HEVBR|nr:hypothetical protein P3X46_015759 [Hevea brasiliensis]
MEPFERSCESPEQKVECGVITVSAKRSGYGRGDVEDDAAHTSEGDDDNNSELTGKDGKQGLKRSRKGLAKGCKKAML